MIDLDVFSYTDDSYIHPFENLFLKLITMGLDKVDNTAASLDSLFSTAATDLGVPFAGASAMNRTTILLTFGHLFILLKNF